MVKKLRIKFIIINMSFVAVMLGVIFGLIFHFTSAQLESESIRMMRTIANQPFQLGIPETPEQSDQDIRLPYFMIHVGPQGELLTINGGYYDLTDKEFLDKMVEAAAATHKDYGVIPEYNLRFYKQDLSKNRCLVFADISSERAIIRNMIRTCIIVGGFSFIVFLGISILLSKWAVRPIEQAMNDQRQFIADASHELKTPLAVIVTNVEMAEDDSYSESEKQQFIHNIHTMSDHMRALVKQMLELSRTDRPLIQNETQTVDLGKVVTNVVLSFEAMLYENGHEISCEIEPDIMVEGNESQLAQVTEILLDNAGKYAVSGGKIQVSLKKMRGRQCLLSVANEGKEIPKNELENLFKRFYRVDPSRNRDGSFGLGLSIAENIVGLHKGRIWAESHNGINTFCVLLTHM